MNKSNLSGISLYKYDWIIDTLNRYSVLNLPIEAETIQQVFNIPLPDAVIILNNYSEGN
jgi:hypothetical protein